MLPLYKTSLGSAYCIEQAPVGGEEPQAKRLR